MNHDCILSYHTHMNENEKEKRLAYTTVPFKAIYFNKIKLFDIILKWLESR
jgi:hypothetical protein